MLTYKKAPSFADFLETILKMRCDYGLFCDKVINSSYHQFSLVINEKKLKLNNDLVTLRSRYQHYQIETMAKFNPAQGALQECHMLTNLCAEFEKKSDLLNLNIKKLIDSFTVLETKLQVSDLHPGKDWIDM